LESILRSENISPALPLTVGVYSQKPFPVFQSNDGFERFYERILTASKEYEKTEVILGIGPTVHYWLNLAYFLEFTQVFPSFWKRALDILESTPFPINLHQSNRRMY
jgi:hypothetical protein